MKLIARERIGASMAIVVLVGLLSLFAGQQAWAAQGGLSAGSLETGAAAEGVAVSPQALSTLKVYDGGSIDNQIRLYGYVSGTCTYDANTKTLTLDNVKADSENGSLDIDVSNATVTVNLVGDSSIKYVYSYASLVVTGSGTLTTSSLSGYNTENASITMKSGKVAGKVSSGASFTMAGGTIIGQAIAYNGPVTMAGGTIQGTLDTSGKLTMKGGTIACSTADAVAVRCYGLVMTGGTIKASDTGRGLSVYYTSSARSDMVMKGGTISIANPTSTGISVSGGNLTQTGGTIVVKNARYNAIDVNNGSKGGGKATFKGGKVTATVKTPKSNYAISASKGIANKVTCFKSIKGHLDKGAQFKAGANLYKVTKYSYATLLKYNAKAKKVTLNKVKFGSYAYEITGIGANAFNTKTGHKVTSITVKSWLTSIGAKAFYNTKALTSLSFKSTGWIKRVYDKKYNLKSLKVNSGCSIAKKAFARCGKGGGKQLKVALDTYGTYRKEAAKYKSFLASRGMSKAISLKQY